MKTCKIAVAMACHNRKEKTLQCLESLFGQNLDHGIVLTVFLVDDSSRDGTSKAVKKYYPEVRLMGGDGNLYWNGAMFKALEEALKGQYAFHLWLNDDVRLYPDALHQLLKTHEGILRETQTSSIIVGTFCDPETGARSYGGQQRSTRWHPLKFKPVFTKGSAVLCQTFQGNGVLVPVKVFEKIGIIEERFSGYQNIGDTEYGLRATRHGFTLYSSPDFIGECKPNLDRVPWEKPGFSFKQRWNALKGPKGLQAGNYFLYARRHGGMLWPVFWFIPMIKALARFFFGPLFSR